MSLPSDEHLAARAARGDLEAAESVARRFLRPEYAVCRRIIRERALAEDAAQEALMTAFRKLDTYRPKRRFSSWILAIAAHVSLNALRKRQRLRQHEATVTPPPPVQGASAPLELRESAEALKAAVDQLPERDAAALYMRFRLDLSFEEIGDALDLQPGAVRVLLCRALTKLHAQLEPAP